MFFGCSIFCVRCYFQVQTPYFLIFIGINQKTYANSVGMHKTVHVAHQSVVGNLLYVHFSVLHSTNNGILLVKILFLNKG